MLLVMGDYNGRAGQILEGEDQIMGVNTYGKRNEGGNRLINFAFSQQLQIGNTYFKKRPARKWTWRSPKGQTFEIDYILTNKINLIKDVHVVPGFNYNSDHRMVRGLLRVEKFMKERPFRITKNKLSSFQDEAEIKQFREYLRAELAEGSERLECKLQERYNHFTTTLNSFLEKNTICRTKKKSKLSRDTLDLLKKRKRKKEKPIITEQEREEITSLNKEIRKRIKQELHNHRNNIIKNCLAENSIRQMKKELTSGRRWMISLDNADGKKTTNRKNMMTIATAYFKELYRCDDTTAETDLEEGENDEEIPEIILPEVAKAISNLKNNKSPGPDGITNEIIKAGNTEIAREIKDIFNLILKEEKIPEQWKTAKIILLFKKGIKSCMDNYRPISLCSTIAKLFTSVLKERLTKRVIECTAVEQAGFRRGFSVTDHIQTINQLIEKSNEYNFPIYLCFVDFKKAFDSVYHNAIVKALREIGTERKYIRIIVELYKDMDAFIRAERRGPIFPVERGVRQGDSLSPLLFILVLEMVFWSLNWENKGIRVNGRYLNCLRFADDIVLISNNSEDLIIMLKDLVKACKAVGLAPNYSKTKAMTNLEKTAMSVGNSEIEYVDEYVYLGQLVSFNNKSKKETERRTSLGWKKYWSLKIIMKGDFPIEMKKRVFETCILPVVAYGCQTWSLTKAQTNRLHSWQRSVERSMTNTKRKDRIRNAAVRKKTGLQDISKYISSLKWNWTGHMMRRQDGRWSQEATKWTPYDLKRNRGRQRKRWRDWFKEKAGPLWWRLAMDRQAWKNKGEEIASTPTSL